MIRISPRNINYREVIDEYGRETCVPHRDCSARDAAVSAANTELSAAEADEAIKKKELENARKLLDSLKAERANVEASQEQYDNIYISVANSGRTLITEENVGGIRDGYKCLDDYLNAVNSTIDSCIKERDRCVEAYAKAVERTTKAKIALYKAKQIPCVWVC